MAVPLSPHRGERTVLVLSGFLVAAVVTWVAVWACTHFGPSSRVRRWRPTTHAYLDGKAFGSPEARVRVLAQLPLSAGCQERRVAYLWNLARSFPGHLHVRFLDIRTPEGRQALQRSGLDCAAILINGKDSVQIDTPGGPKTLVFKGPSEQQYSLADLREALQQELHRAYGSDAPQLPAPSAYPSTSPPL